MKRKEYSFIVYRHGWILKFPLEIRGRAHTLNNSGNDERLGKVSDPLGGTIF